MQKEHYYLLSGDYEHLQGLIDEKFLSVNGVFYFNEKDKKDRKAVSGKMIEHLKQNGNLMYFIEGTWNLTPNLPMLPCYWGIVDIAKEGNAIIEHCIDKDILMQEINCKVVDGKEERYQFTWPDKRKAILAANSPISETLRPCKEESVGK